MVSTQILISASQVRTFFRSKDCSSLKGLGPYVLKSARVKSEITVEMCGAPRQLQGIYLHVFLVWHV